MTRESWLSTPSGPVPSRSWGAPLRCLCWGVVAWVSPATAQEPLSESDYFQQLPVVLTVSRLDQSIGDTPGAVTVIDRETIRRSGARDVAGALRLVPGYMVSGYNGANPNAAYHAPLDDFGTRNLVLVDGRSVYSPFYLGDTHRGLSGVLLDDIERIEVLRGSNSAAYGANAMYGVVNIITRHAADTLGQQASLSVGSGGVRDLQARVGWGQPGSSYRLSAGRREDNGYANAHDHWRLMQTHFRADIVTGVGDELLIEAGLIQSDADDGVAGNANNPLRTVRWRDWYLHGRWQRQLSADEALKWSVTLEEERIADAAVFTPLPAITLDFGGRGRRFNLEGQHQVGLGEGLRLVWGAGYKQDEALSQPLYALSTPVVAREWRLFGNLEWRWSTAWLLNAGLFVGRHNWTGTYTAPRLMVNHHLDADHTLRAGVTRSVRSPTLFELAGDVRYFLGGVQIARTTDATGGARPEALSSQELGYFGHFRDQRLTLDVRAYRERLRDLLEQTVYAHPLPLPPPFGTGNAFDYTNKPGLLTSGLEYQVRWSPAEGTELWFNQNLMRYRWANPAVTGHQGPSRQSTVGWFQKLPANTDFGVLWHHMTAMTWRGVDNTLPSTTRLDLRLARVFRWGGTKAEAALTVQSVGGAKAEYLPVLRYQLERRAFVSLRLEH